MGPIETFVADQTSSPHAPLVLANYGGIRSCAEQMEELQRFGFCPYWTLMIFSQVLLIFLKVLLPHSRIYQINISGILCYPYLILITKIITNEMTLQVPTLDLSTVVSVLFIPRVEC